MVTQPSHRPQIYGALQTLGFCCFYQRQLLRLRQQQQTDHCQLERLAQITLRFFVSHQPSLQSFNTRCESSDLSECFLQRSSQ